MSDVDAAENLLSSGDVARSELRVTAGSGDDGTISAVSPSLSKVNDWRLAARCGTSSSSSSAISFSLRLRFELDDDALDAEAA